MDLDVALIAACSLIASLAALPALQAVHRRRTSRECSEVASGLIDYASVVRRGQRGLPLDEGLLARARQLRIPEVVTFEFAQHLTRPDPQLLADTAQRLALRLKRRVAFERKMLARTAPGRRRGAIAAAVPGIAILSLRMAGVVDSDAGAHIADRRGGLWLLVVVARGAGRGVSMPELLPLLLVLVGGALAVPGFRGLLDIARRAAACRARTPVRAATLGCDARLSRLRGRRTRLPDDRLAGLRGAGCRAGDRCAGFRRCAIVPGESAAPCGAGAARRAGGASRPHRAGRGGGQ